MLRTPCNRDTAGIEPVTGTAVLRAGERGGDRNGHRMEGLLSSCTGSEKMCHLGHVWGKDCSVARPVAVTVLTMITWATRRVRAVAVLWSVQR